MELLTRFITPSVTILFTGSPTRLGRSRHMSRQIFLNMNETDVIIRRTVRGVLHITVEVYVPVQYSTILLPGMMIEINDYND